MTLCSIQPARAALQGGPVRARSGERSGNSAGKSRSYKRTVTYGRGDQPDEDDEWAQQQQQPPQSGGEGDRAPDFASASKKFRENYGGSNSAGTTPGGYGGGGSHDNSRGAGGGGSNVGDRGSRQFNPSKSVVDAINNAGAGNGAAADAAKRKKYAAPSRPDDK